MKTLILGTSKRDCATFAAAHDITAYEWVSPASEDRMRSLTVDAVYATDALRDNQAAFDSLVAASELARAGAGHAS